MASFTNYVLVILNFAIAEHQWENGYGILNKDRQFQSTKDRRSIMGGNRDFQFDTPKYEAFDEDNDVNFDKVNVINVAKSAADTGEDSDPVAVQFRRKRSVRPPKSYIFKESDGASPGTIMFNLDKKHSQEVFKLESANRWVTVDTTGAVRVKEPWDYEQLEKHKSIDFWVFVTGPNLNDPERQSISIRISDVNDEPPYFINRPLPMQAVVQLNAPPGTSVFKLQARDPDTDHNIHYFLVRDRTVGRFEVDERSGEVRTQGNEPFCLDKQYVLYIKAEDHNGPKGDRQFQSTSVELTIKVTDNAAMVAENSKIKYFLYFLIVLFV